MSSDNVDTKEALASAAASVTTEGNVINFQGNKPKEDDDDPGEYILVCAECRCTTFQIKLNGSVTCAECDAESSEVAPQLKVAELVDKDDTVLLDEGHVQKVIRYQNADMDLARARSVRRVNEWYKDGSLVVCIAFCEGEGYAQWAGIETDKERKWLQRKLHELDKWLDTFDLNDDTPSREFADD